MEISSFDVFDTVLTRIWGEPRDLFVRLGEQLGERGLTTLPAADFATERCAAEQRARQVQRGGEVTLPMIYQQLAEALGWSDACHSRAAACEIALETAAIRAVPSAIEAVASARQAGRAIAFLSDMYLPSEVIREWLVRAGAFRAGDTLLVSGEVGAGKGSGALFELAREKLGGEFTAWTHTGDNPFSDGERPRRLGITTVRTAAANLTHREQRLRGRDPFAAPWRSLLAGAAREARLAAPAHSQTDLAGALWATGSAVTGPLFWAFTDWCLRDAETRGLDDLYFLARGGQIFLRIAEAIQATRPSRVRCHYLASSRLAFAGVADLDDPKRLRQLADAPLAFHSVRQACANLGLTASPEILPPAFPASEWDRNLSRAERKTLADWLLAPAQRPAVAAALHQRERLARTYLHQAGLSADARAGVVDTGWMGTIQRSIEHLLGSPGTPAPLTGYYLGISPRPEFDCAGERLAYTNQFRPLRLRRESTHLILLELMARADHGPLLGFDESPSETITPRLGTIEPEARAEVTLFQSAILRFVNARLAAGVPVTAPPGELARLVIENYDAFYRHPSRAEAECFGRMPHADQILEQRYLGLCREMSTREVLVSMSDYHQRPPGWWLQGQAALGHPLLIGGYRLLRTAKWELKSRLRREPD